MGLNSFTKQAFLAVENEYGGTGGTLDRAISSRFCYYSSCSHSRYIRKRKREQARGR